MQLYSRGVSLTPGLWYLFQKEENDVLLHVDENAEIKVGEDLIDLDGEKHGRITAFFTNAGEVKVEMASGEKFILESTHKDQKLELIH